MIGAELDDATELLDFLFQKLNYEFVIYSVNEKSIGDLAMDTNLDEDEIGQWVGSTVNGYLFKEHHSMKSMTEARAQYESFLAKRMSEHFLKEASKPRALREAEDQQAKSTFYAELLQATLDQMENQGGATFAPENIAHSSGFSELQIGNNFSALKLNAEDSLANSASPPQTNQAHAVPQDNANHLAVTQIREAVSSSPSSKLGKGRLAIETN